MKKAYFSIRFYKKRLPQKCVDAITHTLFLVNQAKHFAFQTQVKEKRSGNVLRSESMHKVVKQTYPSVVQDANALMSSQRELKKMYVANKKEQINSINKKMKRTKSRLTVLQKIKQFFVKGNPTFNKTSRERKGNFFVVMFQKKTDIYYHGYQFEHGYLDREIVFLKAKLGRLAFKLDRFQKQLVSLENDTKSVVFGGKKLFNNHYTLKGYVQNRDEWKKDFHYKRYNRMTISGRKDAKEGNFVFHYNTENNALSFQTADGVCVEVPELVFPYGQADINKAIDTQVSLKDKKKYGKPVSWSVEDLGDYYIFKCIVAVPEKESKNDSKSAGVIGVDLNVDHIAWSDINRIGQLTKSGVLHFDSDTKTSGQRTKIIEAEAIALVDRAVKENKPLVLEKLNTTQSKVSHAYGNKKANRRMSAFAYAKLISAIKNRAAKLGIHVYEVNPAYTSQIGKMKYMKRFGISIHQAASFVIARRAMGFKEKLPPMLHSLLPEKMIGLHHWAQWKKVSTLLKDMRTRSYYQSELFDENQFHESGRLFHGALTDYETKGLAKLKSRKTIA